jgi:hypothetical protein
MNKMLRSMFAVLVLAAVCAGVARADSYDDTIHNFKQAGKSGFARCIEDRGLAHDGAAAQQFSPPAHVTLAAPIQVPTAVTEPLTQVHESVAGANCHRSLSVPNAPVESMP